MTTGQRLAEFIRSADLLLSDLELQSAGQDIEIFFDTADIRTAVLGMDAFYDGAGSLQRKEFDDRRTLVQCLAAAGWLGPFSMVAPHQAEFATFINQLTAGRSRRRRPAVDREAQSFQFWRDVGVLQEGRNDEVESLRSLTEKQISEIVSQQVGSADRFFKAVQCISGTWQSRLRELAARRRLLLPIMPEDFASIVASEPFGKFKAAFDDARCDRPVNNFADAAALAILLRKTQEFRTGKSRLLPCFLARPLFHQVAGVAGYREQLTVTLPSGIPTSALRDSDYFLLRAIFFPAQRRAQESNRAIASRFTPEKLRDLRKHIHEILEAQHPLPAEAVKQLDFFGSSVASIVKELERLSFFERVWLPSTAERDTKVALRKLKLSIRLLESTKFRRGLESAVKRVDQDLNANVEGYRVVKRLYDHLLPRYRELRSQIELKTETTEEVIRKLGLIRFAFRPESQERIGKTVRSLLESDQQTESTVLLNVIKMYWNARENIRRAPEEAEVASAILWTADLDDLIIRITHEHRIQHYSLDLVFASSTIRSATDLEAGIARMHDLETRYSGPRMDRGKGDLAVGLGYLYHRLWARVSAAPGLLTPVRRLLRTNRDGLLRRAIALAAEATKLLRDGEQAKRVYALNQYVFYLVLSEPRDMREMTRAAGELMSFQNKADLWQWRYDDTLARYFLRLAATSKSQADFDRYLARATELADLAHAAAKLDRDVLQTLHMVDLRRTAGRRDQPSRARLSARVARART